MNPNHSIDNRPGNIKVMEGLTFDDVLLMPNYSEVLPHEVSLKTKISRNLNISAPFISAAMDTVTEWRCAIAMAQFGGIGIIHKNMPAETQASQVKKVKKSESGMVSDPITVQSSNTVADVLDIIEKQNISGLPVVDGGEIVGIITGRDIRFETDPTRTVGEVMTKEVVSIKIGSSKEDAISLLNRHRIEKLPVVDASGRLVGLYTFKDIIKSKTNPNASKSGGGQLLVGAAVGVDKTFMYRAECLLNAGCDALVVDTAHGHSRKVLNSISELKKNFEKKYDFDVIAGNIATSEAAEALIEAGADGIKVGIGPGSICTTRIIAGVGVPQLSAIAAACEVALKSKIPVIADGGIKFSGDIIKALACGAQAVMLGSILAGTEESPGELIIYQGKSYKSYRGMGSIGAMSLGSKDRYFQENVESTSKFVPEGIEGRVPYRGALADNLYQLEGGLRSGMGYLGASNLNEIYEKAKFVKITSSGLKESHTHDVFITREAPNYKLDR